MNVSRILQFVLHVIKILSNTSFISLFMEPHHFHEYGNCYNNSNCDFHLGTAKHNIRMRMWRTSDTSIKQNYGLGHRPRNL